jgi:hypothetical protein
VLVAHILDLTLSGFLPVHGFSSATVAHDTAEDDDGRELIVLYVGDFDPSGMLGGEAGGDRDRFARDPAAGTLSPQDRGDPAGERHSPFNPMRTIPGAPADSIGAPGSRF